MTVAHTRWSARAAATLAGGLLLVAAGIVAAGSYSAVLAVRHADYSDHPMGMGGGVLMVHFGPPGSMMGPTSAEGSVRIERPSGELVAERSGAGHHGVRLELGEGTYRVTVRIGDVSGTVAALVVGTVGLDAWVEEGEMRFAEHQQHAGHHGAFHGGDGMSGGMMGNGTMPGHGRM